MWARGGFIRDEVNGSGMWWQASASPPAPTTVMYPDLDRLRDAGVPTVSDDEFADALADLDERRRKLLGAVDADEWYWPPLEDE